MKAQIYSTFPILRQNYRRLEDLAQVIGKNRCTVQRKLRTGAFTPWEKSRILEDLRKRGLPTSNIFE